MHRGEISSKYVLIEMIISIEMTKITSEVTEDSLHCIATIETGLMIR